MGFPGAILWPPLEMSEHTDRISNRHFTGYNDRRIHSCPSLVLPVKELHELKERLRGVGRVRVVRDEPAARIAFPYGQDRRASYADSLSYQFVFRKRVFGQIQQQVCPESPYIERLAKFLS